MTTVITPNETVNIAAQSIRLSAVRKGVNLSPAKDSF
jgi:hypothetical protein